tara:strand:+ start:267 stop:641 length:375 start_codon:yes stop_codon:yes gene_type:complete
MDLCEFLTYDGYDFKCKNCGIVLSFEDYQLNEPVYVCNMSIKKNQSFPSFIKKIRNFALATIKHIATGAKMCDDKTIQKRYEICQSCSNFTNNSCSLCGCHLTRNKRFISKLAWKDQKCPINKW